MRWVRVFLVVAVCLSATAVMPRAQAGAARNAALALLDKINDGRTALVTPALLIEDPAITVEAVNHSKFMANKRKISHVGFCDNWTASGGCGASDGIPNSSRAERILAMDGMTNVCENVAYHSGFTSDPVAAAKRLYKQWKNSPGHYNCMFDAGPGAFQANVAGIAVKKIAPSTWYATFLAARDTTP